MWLIVGQLPIKAGWWDASPALRDFNQSNKLCQSPQLGSQISWPHCYWTKIWKARIENWPPFGKRTGVLHIGYQWSQPLYCLQLLLRKVITFYIPIHKVLEQSWRHFASLKLCKCSQIPHPSTRVSSTFCRWHLLRFDTSYKEGKSFLLILKLVGLTCVICDYFSQIVLCLGIFFFPVYCNSELLFLIDVTKIICLSS